MYVRETFLSSNLNINRVESNLGDIELDFILRILVRDILSDIPIITINGKSMNVLVLLYKLFAI